MKVLEYVGRFLRYSPCFREVTIVRRENVETVIVSPIRTSADTDRFTLVPKMKLGDKGQECTVSPLKAGYSHVR